MTKSITAFDVVLVPFPFTDLRTTKKRPCVVLSRFKPKGLDEHFIIAMITSHVSGTPFPGDWGIQDIEHAGLPKESLVRVAKIVTLDSALIQKKLGRLADKDQSGVRGQFKDLFAAMI